MTLGSLAKRVLPNATHRHLRELRRLARRLHYRARKRLGMTAAVTASDIGDGLRRLGVAEGDVVMLHSSLRSLGDVEGGASAVVEAFRQTIGATGTLVVPTLTIESVMHAHFEQYGDDRMFDVRKTPSRMGKITEIVRALPGAHRSVHPSHSAAAVGPQAEYITRDHHREPTAFGKMSPYYRLCELNAKIVMLGVDLTTMTAFHVIEDLVDDFPFEVYVKKQYDCGVVMPDGTRARMTCLVHDPAITAIRDCNKMEPYFEELGILRTTQIGEAKVMCIDGGRLLATMRTLLERGITIYTPKA